MNRRARKIVVTYLTVIALMFNAFASAYAVANSSEQGVLLCTSQGYKWVKVSGDDSTTQTGAEHCKLCLFPPSDDSFDATASSSGELSASFYRQFSYIEVATTSLKASFHYELAQGRAPPFTTHTC